MRTRLPALCLTACFLLLAAGPAVLKANPSLSGSLTFHFVFTPDDPNTEVNEAHWSYSGFSSSGPVLTLPSVLDISIAPSVLGPGTLNWSDAANWTTFPLDTSGFSVGQTGVGSFVYTINNNHANLDVLQNSGPTESQTLTYVAVSSVDGDSSAGFGLQSNFASTHYNVSLPSGAHLSVSQFEVKLQNLTVSAGASITGGINVIRQNLVNHGSGEFDATVDGTFTNDAISSGGNIANASLLTLNGPLQNTGELNVTNWLETRTATSNAGTLNVNGGQFRPQAALANNGTLAFSAGTLGGLGVLTNNGAFQWTGGQFYYNGTGTASVVNASNLFTISGPATKFISGSVTNSGTITQTAGSEVTFNLLGTLTNQSGGLYDITDDSIISSGFQGGFIANAGTFRKSGGSGVSTIGPDFTNTGTTTVASGTLRFIGGGTLNGGTMSFSGGNSIELDSGKFSTIGTNSAAGNGTLKIDGANLVATSGNSGGFANFTGGAQLVIRSGTLGADAGGTMTLNLGGASSVLLTRIPGGQVGDIGGAGSTVNAGNFHWNGGNVAGNLSNTSANFVISGGDGSVFGGHLTNQGTITQTGASTITVGGFGVIENKAGALYDFTDDSDILQGFNGGTLINTGTFRKSGGSDVSSVLVPFFNTGILSASSGTLSLAGGGALNGGSMIFANGKSVQVANGILSLTGVNTASGQGTFEIAGGHLMVASGETASFANFIGGANLTVRGGYLEAAAGGTFTLNLTGTSKVLLGAVPGSTQGQIGAAGTVINSGNFELNGGNVGGNLTNTSANFTILGDQSTVFSGHLINQGTIIQSGNGSITVGGTGSIINAAGALYNITDDSSILPGFNSGTISNAGILRKSGGSGISKIYVPISNTGTIGVNTGTLQINAGPVVLNSTSTLDFTLGGTAPATDLGKLEVIGALTLAGTLHVSLNSGFSPAQGNSFDLLDWSTSSGNFATLQLAPLGIGLAWNTSELYTAGVLSIIPNVLGDFSRDGQVTAADAPAMLNAMTDLASYSAANSLSAAQLAAIGDFDHSGAVTNRDIQGLLDLLGSPGGGSVAEVPEPGSFALFCAAGMFVAAFHRRFDRLVSRG